MPVYIKKKKRCWFLIGLVFLIMSMHYFWPTQESHLREGDIVFRGTGWGVAAMTMSKWTHCGILLKENHEWIVYEANGRVKKTPLQEWKRHGEIPYLFRVMRFEQPLTDSQLKQMCKWMNSHRGRKYDNEYRWSDQRLYCSEFVWKAYNSSGLKLSDPRKASTFFLYKVLPHSLMSRFVEKKGISLEEPMVPPCDLINSRHLQRVW